jgi:hypothetical protein
MKLEFSLQTVETALNTKRHKNPSSGSRVVPFGQTHMTELIVAFRNFANAPTKYHFRHKVCQILYWNYNICFLYMLIYLTTMSVTSNT